MVLFSRNSRDTLLEIVHTSMRYIACFLIQIKMRLGLHFRTARSQLSLLPPSIPPMNRASQHDGPYELGSTAILWPWLQDGLAGTPLAGLSSAFGHRWAGYYTYSVALVPQERYDPPMLFKLHLAPPPAPDKAGYKVYFCGEGADSVGQFTLEGSSDSQTGAVVARKTYVGAHWWDWYGVTTPFGMVGVWGPCTDVRDTYGWWWIWPQEWSEQSTDPAATVTR
jgi:hypothetical protein